MPLAELGVGVGVIWAVVLGLRWALGRFATGQGGVYGTVEGFVGRPGQGKTTLAVRWALQRAVLIRGYGRRVVIASNIDVRAPEGIETRLLKVGADGFDVVDLVRLALEVRSDGGALVLLVDEAGICMPARMWRFYGPSLMWLFQQSRKLHVEVVWTAQSETFVDAQLRMLTAATHQVAATPPATVLSMLSGKRPHWLTVSTFDRTAVGVVDAHLGKSRHRYRQEWEATFDTEAFVLPPEKLDGAGDLLELLREYGLAEAPVVALDSARRSRGQWEEPAPRAAVIPGS